MMRFVYLKLKQKLKQLLNILDKVVTIPKFYIYRWLGFRIIHCLGDSHVAMFEYIKQNKLLKKTKINCTIVGGGTAMGMVNPNSKTNALQIFKTKINNISKQDYIFLLLGEVDCGFLIWYRAKKYNHSVSAQFETSLTNYFKFITWLIEREHNIVVCSAPLPTIYDDQPLGEILMREDMYKQRYLIEPN